MKEEKTIELYHPRNSHHPVPTKASGHPSSTKEGIKEVTYTLRRSRRARGVRLCVASGGLFTVTAPPWMGESRIEKFIFEKSGWVLDKIRYFKQFAPRPRKMMNTSSRGKHFREHKKKAWGLVQARLVYFNQHYGFTWRKITIRNQRSRWGSCSRKKNLNFNYKIALLPAHLADYIIVHELCHLGELNHSPKFWKLVAQTMPEHRKMRTELRKVVGSLL